jgi:CRISPR-associated endonuclease/helicase Cas3
VAAGYLRYWGKARPDEKGASWHLLAYHSLDVAAVAAELIERDPALLRPLERLSGFTEDSLRAVLPYLLALHDLGKFSEPFQDLKPDIVAALQGPRPARHAQHRHDTLGYLLWRSWGSRRAPQQDMELFEALFPVVGPSGALAARDIDDVLQSWLAAVLGHHGRPPRDGTLGLEVFARGAASRTDAVAFAQDVRALLAPGPLVAGRETEALGESARRASWWLAGFAILCDWLASDSTLFWYQATPVPVEDYWPVARDRARISVRRSGLTLASPRPYEGFGSLFPAIASRPSPLQAAAATVDLGEGPRLFVLEDLTGSGKTEAGLVVAHRLMAAGKATGLFFALPTTATANAMADRVRPLVDRLFDGQASFVLAHSGPRLTDDDRLAIAGNARPDAYGAGESPTATGAASNWLADSRKKALLAHLGVGTIDQALLAALQSRHAALRLFGLHHHVLLVDEVHACDAYMRRILCTLLTAHAALGGSAILLSATLPLWQRQELADAFARGLGGPPSFLSATAYPLLTAAGVGGALERAVDAAPGSQRAVTVEFISTPGDAVATIAGAAREGRCVCWVRNSVADAFDAFDALTAELGRESVTLFHARFALGDRLRIEQSVVDRFGKGGTPELRRGQVVVATQVVEQSLDLDFDEMVTDLCPVDLVIQRAGRLQRHPALHPGRLPPRLHVLAPPWSDHPPRDWLGGHFRRTAMVYGDPGVLWRTARELHLRGKLVLPADARALVEAAYGEEGAVPDALLPRSDAAVGASLARASVAQNNAIKLGVGYLREGSDWSDDASTPTRLGEPTTTVRLARVGDSGTEPWFDGDPAHLRWQLSQVSVARRLVTLSHPEDEAACRELEAGQPFLADDIVTIPLRQASDGLWAGRAMATRMRGGESRSLSVGLAYSRERGLQVTEGV